MNFSVIIPHYNIPDLLLRCVRSIPHRTDTQIIIVDDGSPEVESYHTLYPELFERTEFFSVQHIGKAGVIRNIGLNHAAGKWITFLDADDFFTEQADAIFDLVLNCSEDLLFFNCKSVISSNIDIPSKRWNTYSNQFLEANEHFLRYYYPPLWGKIIRKDLILRHKISFGDTIYSNDVLFSVEIGIHAEKIRIFNNELYCITEREGSIAYALLHEKMSVKEHIIRVNVAWKKKKLMKKNNIQPIGVFDSPVYYWILCARQTNLICYYLYLIHALFFFPDIVLHLLKRDFRYFFKLIWQHPEPEV